ncbi:MAG TPA: wax ester/triacylglycerol synthase family O-acyltransferase [Myxococcales bacterium]|nr:wax ester/triacylglycerol synthase family O-acyltransferase [Myxococcales bacterium]
MSWFERLTSLDFTFLNLEDRTAHMHVAGLAVFDGPLPPYQQVLRLIDARLESVPRYRQRLQFVPLNQGRPVWVDEESFDLEYHVRHTALPAPGTIDQLHKLAGWLMSQQLDRSKPLWEMWLVEGVKGEDGGQRFAIVTKTHHCMIDGISGIDIASVLMDGEPEAAPPPSSGPPWRPRPAPNAAELLVSSLREQVVHPLRAAREAMRAGSPARTQLLHLAAGLKPLLGLAQMGRAPESSLNAPLSPHRRFHSVDMALADIKAVRTALGGTVNDVVLAVVAGALRSLLGSRGEPASHDLRVMVPVSVRTAEGRGTLGNQVTPTFATLPVTEADPVRRLEKVRAAMKGLKESGQVLGALALTKLSDFAPPNLLTQVARLQMMERFFNLVVTNVPGPQFPLYLLGRRMLACYPVVPLAAGQTVGIALLSYNGSIGVGLLGDADEARDLAELGDFLKASLQELLERAQRAPVPEPAAQVRAAAGAR